MSQVNYNRQFVTNAMWLIDKVYPITNTKLDATTKMVTLGLVQEFALHSTPLSHPLKVWYGNIQENTGLSKESIVSSVAKLAKVRAITKETKKVPCAPTNEKKNRTFIAFTPEFLSNPVMLFVDVEESNHGGKRESIRCPHCDEYHPLKQRTTITCSGCGSVIEELTKVITLDNEAPTNNGYTEEEKQQLADLKARTESLVSIIENYGEVSSIPDFVVSEMGGIEAVEKASPQKIAAEVENYEDMQELAYQATQEFKSRKQQPPTVTNDYWTGEE